MEATLISERERELYNRYIESAPKSHVFQLYEWGELKATTGWEPIRLIIQDEERIVGAISILKRRLPIVGKNIFYAPRGPICDPNDCKTMDFMWMTIRELAKKHNAIFLKIDPDITVENQSYMNYLHKAGFIQNETGKNFEGIQPKFVFRLALDKPLDNLLSNMKNKTRYNIRYAERKGVRIVDDCAKEHLRAFYDILKVTAARDNFGIRAYEYYENMWDILVPSGYMKLFMAEYEGSCISGALAMKCGDTVWYVYGASANNHRNKQPNYAVQWRMINWAYENGGSVYDFRGVSGDLNESNPLYGLYRFKIGFGAKMTEYIGEYDLVFSPLYYSLWTKALPAVKRWRSKLGGLIK